MMRSYLGVLLGFSFALNASALSVPASGKYCSAGDHGKGYAYRGAACTCSGWVYYCAKGNRNNCQKNKNMGSVSRCDYSGQNFYRRHYGARSECYCHIPGCNAGQHGPGGSCKNCGIGKYQSQNQYTGTSCHNCPSGQYQGSNGGTGCKHCWAGMYQASDARWYCDSCPAGQYQNGNAKSSCKACPKGYYQAQGAKSSCNSCPAGQYQDSTQQTSCVSCSAGKYQPHKNQASCADCGKGKYQDKEGQTSCKNCGKGAYQDITADTDSSSFTFVEADSEAPFKITKKAVGGKATASEYEIFTTARVELNSKVKILDFETGNTQYDITVHADDGKGGKSEDSLVTFIVLDDNDKPYLDLSDECANDKNKFCVSVNIKENNNEGTTSVRHVDLASFTEDQDTKSGWKCCRNSRPYTLDVPSSSMKCSLDDFVETQSGFYAKARRFNYENSGHDSCQLIVKVHDKAGKSSIGWNEQHDAIGLPYISCEAQRTIVGAVNISIFVAGQQGQFLFAGSTNRLGVHAACFEEEESLDLETGKTVQYWGRNYPAGELCAKCQAGALCKPGEYDAPTSLAGYYIVDLDITANSAKQPPNGEENLIERRSRRDYDRALESFRSDGERVCAPERLLDETADSDIVKEYDFALKTKRDLCHVSLPCKPVEACKGLNKCEIGYQYQEPRCNASSARNSADGGAQVQKCNHTLQCQVLSSGRKCSSAVSSVCKCPADWELGSRECLKNCVMNKDKMSELEAGGCSYKLLERSLAGIPCAYDNPEDCATCETEKVCVRSDGSYTGAACRDDNFCSLEYGLGSKCEIQGQCSCGPSSRCVLCTAGTHYRLDGKCEECPQNMELVFAGFFVGIFLAIVAAYILDKKKFNLAFIIIPVDYFQVLALMSRADIRWPKLLLQILRALQFFNFNIDIATPECLLAGVFTYEMKFYGTLLFAPIAVIFLIVAYVWHQVFNRVCMRHAPDKLYISKLIGTFMMLIYCVYLSCTTRALEVFNCSPSDPDDGWLYVGFTDLSCDGGGLCRCGDSEHLPAKLTLPALISLLCYTVGFPLFLFWLLRCGNRKQLLKEDQILRASGLGDSTATNPRAFHIRVRYHKMYYYYKPGKSYWMLVILARKVAIAFCSLIFRTNPGFMLASIVLILFIAFSLQTRHSPFMSSSQKQLVLAEHAIKAEAGDHLHLRIRSDIEHVHEHVKHRQKAISDKRQKMRFSTLSMKVEGGRNKSRVEKFMFDYNTVEQFLLFCAIIVCIAGIMFESDRFQEASGGKLRYAWQRDMVTFVVIFIVFQSFVYLAVVIYNEITGSLPVCFVCCGKNKEDALLKAAKTIQDKKDDEIEMNVVNPSLVNGMGSAERTKYDSMMAAQQKRAMLAEKEKEALLAERRALRNMVQSQKRSKKVGGRARKKKEKNDFVGSAFVNGKASATDDSSEELQLLSGEKERKKKSQSFQKYATGDGKIYYSNIETKETVWTLPADAVVV